MDSIQGICREAKPDGTLGAQTLTGTAGGPGGDTVFSTVCKGPNGIAKVAVYWTLPPIEVVHSLIFACHAGIHSTDGGGVLKAGPEKSAGEVPGAAAGSHNATLTCPDKKFAVGIKGKAGSYVDSIGVLCDTPFVGPAPSPAATKGSAPGAAGKQLPSGGGPSSQPSAPGKK